MSVLDTPRLYFTGQMVWDPIVTNNYGPDPTQTPPFVGFYDEDACIPLPADDPVGEFRRRAIEFVDPANWNPHGTHRSSFLAQISGVDTGGGLDRSDPVVGAPANFLGMLVDAEPYGTFSSQLFFDAMQFGVNGGYRIACPRTFRVMSRYVYFNRNSYNTVKAGVASVIWQTSFPKDCGLQLDAHDSPALQALVDAMDQDDVLGLTVRWNTYRTIYYDDPTIVTNVGGQLSVDAQKLIAKLNIPDSFQPNPARSLMVGVVGLWRQGEPACEPGDRALLAQGKPFGQTVGTAFAKVAGEGLVIDLGNSVREIDAEVSKQPLGDLTVCAMSANGSSVVQVLGIIPYSQYDRDSYVDTSGLVCLPLDPSQADIAISSPLQIRSGANVYLAEPVVAPSNRLLRAAVMTDQNIYMNQGDASVRAGVRVLDTGYPTTPGIQVNRYSYDDASGAVTPVDDAQTDSNGIAWFNIEAASAGAVDCYLFTVGEGAAQPATLDPQINPYIYVRTLPADAEIGAMEPTWENVFNNVLAKWNAMAPCMDNWLWLNDPAQVHAYGRILRRLTDPAAFEAYRYMPVVRDMTQGERTLLYAFLDSPLDPDAKPFRTRLAEAAAKAPKALPEGTRLSRAMRA
ncbi:MAG: hypothetical protein QOJ91_1108 [Sphingomonadales bacterium]|jgi:hypothetical protein|nr:hypothetical protein [Sphingomonadales bacterium]